MDRPSGIDRRTLARHIGADVDRVAPLLARILLVRAIGDILGGRDREALWVAVDVISDCEGGGEFAVAGATTRALAGALAPAHDVDRDLTTAVTAVKQLNWTLKAEKNAYARYSVVTDPDNSYIDPEQSDETWTRWQEYKRGVDDAVGGLPADLGRGEVQSLLLDRAIDRVFERGLLYSIRYVFAGEPEGMWRCQVAKILLDAARVGLIRGRAGTVESLADDVHAGRRALVEATSSAWAREAANHLVEIAVPVATREEPLTADKVTAIRLAALCLAHESQAARMTAAGDAFRDVVVGITLMERDTAAGTTRNGGTTPASTPGGAG
ncbi:hypothetical protein [Actinomadura rudentiformis]|uniref:Uncharacterized protein n=1 Tax=Actinomadura rudentiformis TaxID=359158 RepID=A0A6H9YQX0_9ACTN|nr:hypothetical protein [Actinomadura rudentiformis]KAB2350304.1 hypothetical protein F8566_11035 [Actinomadura rudentiformis]